MTRITLAALFVMASAAAATAAETPTFSKDVAPIFYEHCAECHRPAMFAPMSLMSYDEARPWLRSIKQRVVARTMPPWGSDQPHGVFKNDPRLSDAEVATIVAWIDGGAPKGDDRDLPARPQFAEGWTIGKPDAVFSMTEEFKIPASGTIEYQYIRIPVNLPEDRWMQAIEIKPGARAHVHHVLAYTQPAGEPIRESGALGPTNLGGVTPNKPGMVYPPGVARLLRGKSDLILQIHYTTNGSRRHGAQSAVRDPGGRSRLRSARRAGPRPRHRPDDADAAHARAREGHDLHRALSRRHVGNPAVGAAIRLQLADHL
jgi:mono/diheme cytochrome c family protein